MLQLLSLLQTRCIWSGLELADRLSTTERTIRRDIDRLRELGYPVEGLRGPVGGYRLESGTNIPPLLLDVEEAVAIAVTLRTATGGLSGIEETALRALVKLEHVLPKRLRTQVTALQESLTPVAFGSGARREVNPAVLMVLATACRDSEIITFEYQGRHDEAPARRCVEPTGLVTIGNLWYLVGYDVEKADWRIYRLERLADPIPTGRRVPPRRLPAADPAAYVATKIATAPAKHRAIATVQASAETVRRRTSALPDRITPLGDQSCEVDLSDDSLPRIAQHLAAIAADYTLEADPDVLEHLRTMAYRALDASHSPSRSQTGLL